MKAIYKMILLVEAVHEIDDMEGLKSGEEYATDVCNMIADEATMTNGVVCYEVLESELTVK